MVSSSITVTELPTFVSGSGARFATTTISFRASSGAASAPPSARTVPGSSKEANRSAPANADASAEYVMEKSLAERHPRPCRAGPRMWRRSGEVPADARNAVHLPSPFGNFRSLSTPRLIDGRPRKAGLLARGSIPSSPSRIRSESSGHRCWAYRLQLRGQPGLFTRVPFESPSGELLVRREGASKILARQRRRVDGGPFRGQTSGAFRSPTGHGAGG